MAPPVFFVGTLVEVDQMKTGYIIEIDNTNNDCLVFIIVYPAECEQEERVVQTRCRPVSLRRSTATRSGTIHRALPQSDDPPPLIEQTPTATPTPPARAGRAPLRAHNRTYTNLKNALKKTLSWDGSVEHPLYLFLQQGDGKTKGWLRDVIPAFN